MHEEITYYVAFIKRLVFELGGMATLGVRNLIHTVKIAKLLTKCRSEIEKAIEFQGDVLSPDQELLYVEIVKDVVKKLVPHEQRPEIFNAFATIALAKRIKHNDGFVILRVAYRSPKQAIAESINLIKKTWQADVSLFHQTKCGIKSAALAVANTFKKKP